MQQYATVMVSEVFARLAYRPILVISIIVIIVGGTFIISTVARGYLDTNGSWPKGVIHYWSDAATPLQHAAILTATQQWDQAGLGVKFVSVKRPGRAQLIIDLSSQQLSRQCRSTECLGYTSQIGYHAGQSPTHIWLTTQPRFEQTITIVQVVAHELGHVLGLDHVHGRQCALMDPDAGLNNCQADWNQGLGNSPCGPTLADVKRAGKLYHQYNRNYHSRCWTLITGYDGPPRLVRLSAAERKVDMSSPPSAPSASPPTPLVDH